LKFGTSYIEIYNTHHHLIIIVIKYSQVNLTMEVVLVQMILLLFLIKLILSIIIFY
jgi:hypothetical protein